jgi:hypothetical protein
MIRISSDVTICSKFLVIQTCFLLGEKLNEVPLFAFAIDSLGLKQTTQQNNTPFPVAWVLVIPKQSSKYPGSTMILSHMNSAPHVRSTLE